MVEQFAVNEKVRGSSPRGGAKQDAAGIERSYMGTIERGERNPTLMKVYNIAKALKVSAGQLLPF